MEQPKFTVGQQVKIRALNPRWSALHGKVVTVLSLWYQWQATRDYDTVGWWYRIDASPKGGPGDSVEYGLEPVPEAYDGNTTVSWKEVPWWQPNKEKTHVDSV